MPSDSGQDVKILLKEKVPSPNAHWIIVERDKKKLQSFKNKKLIKNTTFYNQELSSIPILKLNNIDFAWFDFCGNLTKNDVLWFKQFILNPNCDLFFTFSLIIRGNTFFTQLSNSIYKKFTKEILQIVQHDFNWSSKDQNLKNEYLPVIAVRWLLLKYLFPPATSNCYFYKDTVP